MAGPEVTMTPPIEAGRPQPKPEILKQESGFATTMIIREQGKKLRAGMEEARQRNENPNEWLGADADRRRIVTAVNLQELTDESQLTIDFGQDEHGNQTTLNLKDGKKVTKVTKRVGESFECEVEGADDPVRISRQDVLDSYLLAEGENILATADLTPAQKTVIENRIKLLKGDNTVVEGENAVVVEDAIKEVAKSDTSISAEALRQYINIELVPLKQATNLTPQQVRERIQRENALTVLEGRNIVDPDTFIDVLGALGIGRNLGDQIKQIDKQIEEAERNKAKHADSPRNQALIQEDIDYYKQMQQALRQSQSAMQKDGELHKTLTKASEGAADSRLLARMGRINEALKNGDSEALIKAFMPELDDDEQDSASEKDKKANRIKFLKKVGIGGGLAALFFFMLMKSNGQPQYG